MFLEWVASLVLANGVVVSALVLAFLTYSLKFIAYRQLAPTDFIVAIAEVPTMASGTCCSLLVAGMYLPLANSRLLSVYLMITVLVFVVNVGIYRFIDNRKLALNEIKGRVISLSLASYSLTYYVSVLAASYAFKDVGA